MGYRCSFDFYASCVGRIEFVCASISIKVGAMPYSHKKDGLLSLIQTVRDTWNSASCGGPEVAAHIKLVSSKVPLLRDGAELDVLLVTGGSALVRVCGQILLV